MNPTPQQAHIVNLLLTTTSHLIINSYAGTGKSSTLKIIDHASPTRPILYLAFGRRGVEEAKAERELAEGDASVFAFSDSTKIQTFNGLGHNAWRDINGRGMEVSKSKTRDLLRLAINALPKRQQSEAWDEYWEIVSAVGLAKNIGYIPEGKFTDAKRLALWRDLEARLDTKLSQLGEDLLDEVLVASIKASYGGSIDYDDQIYMPALFGGAFPSFPLVLVDEAQDLNPCNHEMLRKLRQSRIVAVGDPRQSIYAFRGAVPGGMATLKATFEMVEAELTVSFRCPETIVQAVRWHVPQMQAHKRGGHASRLTHCYPGDFPDNCAILCRNNAPLFQLAFKLLGNGRSVNVAGSEVGPKVIAIMRKLANANTPRQEVFQHIQLWLEEKLAHQSSTASDIAGCMRVFAERGQTLGAAIAYAENLFAQSGTISLLTGHKAKGLEWDCVFHLDNWLIGEDEQELNLRYVVMTRSKDRYYEIDSRDIRWT